jgi:hypothetical protein
MTDAGSVDEGFETENPEREAFEACFPPEAFGPIALALSVAPTPQNISVIRGWLIPFLEESFSGDVVKEPTVTERKKELTRLRDALALVWRASGTRHGAATLSWSLGDLRDGVPEKFAATLQRLRRGVEGRLRELSATPVRRGPKPKTTFRDFTPDLVRLYNGMTGKEAKKPYWLDNSGIYGGDFYLFAVEVWKCLRERVPQVKHALPSSEGALAQELQDHWPTEGTKTG